MGVVYQARDRRLGRSVALKRLPDNLRENPTAVQLFLREARAAAALNHPNIVTLFDADQEDGNYYLTMEFLDGLPLDKILAKRGRLSARDCVPAAACRSRPGSSTPTSSSIVHRDIKTSNLFFTRDRVVKIMDFGLAKMVAGGAPRGDRDRRHAVLHGARAGDRRGRRPPRRPLRLRRHALRAADRHASPSARAT